MEVDIGESGLEYSGTDWTCQSGGGYMGGFQTFDEFLNGRAIQKMPRKISKEVREHIKKYRTEGGSTLKLIYIHDLEGTFIETNLNFIKEMGYTEEDSTDLNFRGLLSGEDHYQFEDYLRKVKESGKDQGLMYLNTKDGHTRIFEYKNRLVYGSTGTERVRGSAKDVTERIHAEKKLIKINRELDSTNRELEKNIERSNKMAFDAAFMESPNEPHP